MRLLLDTHIWLWALDNPKRLGRSTSRQLAAGRNVVSLSAVSIWEYISLAQKGRFSRVRDPMPWLDRALTQWPVRELSLNFEIVKEAGQIRLPHADPADRLIVATARVFACTLVTEDANIIASRLVDTIPND